MVAIVHGGWPLLCKEQSCRVADCGNSLPRAVAQADTPKHVRREAQFTWRSLEDSGVSEGAGTRRAARFKGPLRENGMPLEDDASSAATSSGLVQVRPTLQQGSGTPLMCAAIPPGH